MLDIPHIFGKIQILAGVNDLSFSTSAGRVGGSTCYVVTPNLCEVEFGCDNTRCTYSTVRLIHEEAILLFFG